MASLTSPEKLAPGLFPRKRALPLTARFAPSLAPMRETVYLSWVDRETGNIVVTHTRDFSAYDQNVPLPMCSATPTALVGAASGLLVMAWVEPETQELAIGRSLRGRDLEREPGPRARTPSAPALAWFGGRFWLLWRDAEANRLRLMNSADGVEWREENELRAETEERPSLLATGGSLLAVWRGAEGSLWQQTVSGGVGRPVVLLEDAPNDYTLAADETRLYLSYADHAKGLLHFAYAPARGSDWQTLATLHERCGGAPAVVRFAGKAILAWVRDDAEHKINIAVEQAQGDGANEYVFTGDVQGHPTALDPEHQTPYPYLGIVVLPSDMSLPKGQTEASLTAGLSTALAKVKDFWAEASYEKVALTYEVHPQVVNLPNPMSDYMVRARPKLIDGFGVTFPVTFKGGETLVIEGTNGYSVTVTFPPGSMSRDDIVNLIIQELGAAPFAGDPAEKPTAYRTDIGQLRIQTAGHVDPGTHLTVAGTAVGMLGFGPADVSIYEGSKTQDDRNLELMLCDAAQAVANTKPDPAGYLNQFFGVVISLASNLGWYAIRANASIGPGQHQILENQKPWKGASYYVTTPEAAEVFAHETGHNLLLPDLYQEGLRYLGAEVGYWDTMDSNAFSHPSAWEKAFQSNVKAPQSRWMATDHVKTLDKDTGSIEVLLLPNETRFPQNNPFAATHPGVPLCHAIRIPLDHNHAFYVENRQKGPFSDPGLGPVNYSQYLPGSGLVITDAVNDVAQTGLPRAPLLLACPLGLRIAHIPESIIDEVATATTKEKKLFILSAFVPSEIPQWVADKIAAAASRQEIEGIIESYQDSQVSAYYPLDTLGKEVVLYQLPDGSGDIRIKILEVIGAKPPKVYKVRASWGIPGSWFDLEIRKGVPWWESPDIWVDSEENGWGNYQHHDSVANPKIPGNPVLIGDRPWIGHVNRVYARVWNHGNVAVNNLRVDFEVMSPPGQSSGYPLGSHFIDIPAGGYAVAELIWRPLKKPTEGHACIVAKAEYRPYNVSAGIIGERNANNNWAQQNISDFYVEKGSPYTPVTVPFEFANPLPIRAEIRLRAQGLRPGWTLAVAPYRFTLDPGERIEGVATLAAADSVPLEDWDETNPPPVVALEALVRTGCTWERFGGFSMVAHTVRRSTLRLFADMAGNGVYVTALATADGVAVANGNVAFRVVGPNGKTLAVSRGATNSEGRITLLVPVDWDLYPHGTSVDIEGRLTPSRKFGPAEASLQVRR